ncbi:hypothetical protein LPY66_10820 [Dehalobacter sp. DCM]|uniref:hypothetical protein n=1 Tax=Dehalobacter sp. DCM TaxID=2907827 RepID=UPI0030818C80|nr:hypothetical protein LPY66_10820 [Dehalobacter sp. DCM]
MDLKSLDAANIQLRISSEMIKEMIANEEKKSIQELSVIFGTETITFTGKLNWKLVKIPFEIVLRLTSAKERTIYFTVEKFAPINALPIKNTLLQRPPLLKYTDPHLELNLDGIAALKNIPYGHIKDVRIQDQSFLAQIGF